MLGRNSNPKIGFDFTARQIMGRFTTPPPSNPHLESGYIRGVPWKLFPPQFQIGAEAFKGYGGTSIPPPPVGGSLLEVN